MVRNVTLRLILIYHLCLTILTIDNRSAVDAIAWPECGEFVFPKDDINLSAEEKQFRRKLPTLFDSYDSGNATGIENTLKSLEKFDVPFVTERKKLAKQTLSPMLDIVSSKCIFFKRKIDIKSFIHPSIHQHQNHQSSLQVPEKRNLQSDFY